MLNILQPNVGLPFDTNVCKSILMCGKSLREVCKENITKVNARQHKRWHNKHIIQLAFDFSCVKKHKTPIQI
jgi:hypothetical protein